jgi:riboflavin biosynthesis pyrimidine reductase
MPHRRELSPVLRSLLPEATDQVDLVERYSRELRLRDGRPFVRVNMVSTLDGAIALGGRAGQISGPADRALFLVLRSLADLVLVGAGTARAENYGPVKLGEDLQQRRVERGQSPLPRLAVVTHRVDLDFGSRLFVGSSQRPIVIAPGGADPGALAEARLVADVLTTGAETLDLPTALAVLGDQGIGHILCEGGPTLNESLVAASLLDEFCLTLSPKLALGAGEGLVRGWLGNHTAGPMGRPVARLMDLGLVHVLEEDGFLFLRLRAS